MSLGSLVSANVQRPSITLRLAGRRVRGVLRASAAWTFGAGIGGGTVELVDPPTTPRPGQAISWTWGYSGVEVPGFTGTVSRILRRSYPNTWTLEVKDALAPAERRSGSIQTSPLNDITAQAAIQYILTTYAGNPPEAIPAISLTSGGPAWTLGTLTPVSWSNSSALAAMQEIAGTAGYWLYADPGGTVRARQMERRPSSSPFRTFRRGVDLLVEGAPEREQNASTVKNRVTVRGANTGVGGAQLFDTWEATHAVYPGETHTTEFNLPLLEDIDDVTAVAQRLVSLYNRDPNVITATIPADPRLFVGTTVAIQDSGIGFSSPVNYFIYALETSIDTQAGAFAQRLTLDGGLGPTGYTTIPPPVAVITAQTYRENLNGTEVIEVFVNGAGSYSQSEGEIVSWAWTTGTTQASLSPSPPAGSSSPHDSPVWVFVYPAATGTADITLTVTDTTSKTGDLTIAVDLSAPQAVSPLSVAFGAAWEYTADAGTTWSAITTGGDAVAVPPYGSGWTDAQAAADVQAVGLLATRASGGTGVQASLDSLLSTVNRADLGAAITMLWQHERQPLRVWAAVGDTVYRSIDGGATFAAMAKPASGTNVTWIIEDPALIDSVFAAAGNVLYHATNPAAGWATLFTAPSGSTIRQFVRSQDGGTTWACLTGTFSGSPLQRVEGGISANFPVVSPVVAEIRTVALLESSPITLYAVDSERRIWQVHGESGAVTALTSTLPSGATAMHALADPTIPMPLIYIADFDSVAAGTGAVRKLLPTIDRLYPYRVGTSGRQAHQIGLGSGGAVEGRILLATWGVASGGVWELTAAGSWVFHAISAGATVYWRWLAVDPFNPRRWLALGNTSTGPFFDRTSGGSIVMSGTAISPLWYTDDGGNTWTAVSLSGLTGGALIGQQVITSVWFDPTTGGDWSLITGSFTNTSRYRGSAGSAGSPGVAADGAGSYFYNIFTAGLNGELITAISSGSPGVEERRRRVWPAASNTLTIPSGAAPTDWPITRAFRRQPGTLRGVARSIPGSGIWASADYRNAQDTLRIVGASSGAEYAELAWATHGLYWVASGGIWRTPDVLASSPSSALVQAWPDTGVPVAVDTQTGTVLATVDYSTTPARIAITTDGIAWVILSGPPGVAGSDLSTTAVAPLGSST